MNTRDLKERKKDGLNRPVVHLFILKKKKEKERKCHPFIICSCSYSCADRIAKNPDKNLFVGSEKEPYISIVLLPFCATWAALHSISNKDHAL